MGLPRIWKSIGLAILLVAPCPQLGLASGSALDGAIKHYRNLEPEKAIPALRKVLYSAGLGKSVRVKALVYLGLSLYSIGKQKEAEVVFAKALRIEPGAKLPTGESPKTIRFFSGVKSRLKPLPKATGKGKAGKGSPPKAVATAADGKKPAPGKSAGGKGKGKAKGKAKGTTTGAGKGKPATGDDPKGGDEPPGTASTAGGMGDPGPPPKPPSNSMRTVSYVLMGATGAALGVGTVFGFMALAPRNKLSSTPKDELTQLQAQSLHDQEVNRAAISTAGFITAGVSGVVAGVLFFLSRPSKKESANSPSVKPTAVPGGAGLVFSLSFR